MSSSAPTEAGPAGAPGEASAHAPTLVYLVTEDWYFVSHRLALARAARAAGYRVIVATRIRDHRSVIEAAGCEVVPLPWRRRGAPLGDLITIWRLRQLYRQVRPALVHQVALKPVVLGSVAAALAPPTIRVNAVAGLGHIFSSERLGARLLRPALRLALRAALSGKHAYTVTQNRDDATLLTGSGTAPADRLSVIRGAGVSLSTLPPPPATGPVRIVLPARMIWSKGVGEFVAAARMLRAEGSPVEMLLAGDPDLDNAAAIPREQLQAWHQAGDVTWLGHRDDMDALLASCHVVCLPSKYGEGIPKSLLEGAAAGRPLVATDIPGCREVVREENGVLVPPGDAAALAAALRELASDPARRARLGWGSRRIAEEEFAEDRIIAETLALYARARACADS